MRQACERARTTGTGPTPLSIRPSGRGTARVSPTRASAIAAPRSPNFGLGHLRARAPQNPATNGLGALARSSPRSHAEEPRDKRSRRPWLGHRRVSTPENLATNGLGALARSWPRTHAGEPCARRVPCQPAPAARRSQLRTHGAPQPLLGNKAALVTPHRPRLWRGTLGSRSAGNGEANTATSHCRIIKTRVVPNWRGPKSTAPSNNALHRTRFARR